MPEVQLTEDWGLITSETTFTAQNISQNTQRWIFAASLPAASDNGFIIEYAKGVDDSFGTGNLYGKGSGSVLVSI